MPRGSCLCGKIAISTSEKPAKRFLCYCSDCCKVSGSVHSTNLFVPNETFSLVSGTPKEFSKSCDARGTIPLYFCGQCGSTLWRASTRAPDVKFVKEGVLDEISNDKPVIELYSQRRVEWLLEIAGAQQKTDSVFP